MLQGHSLRKSAHLVGVTWVTLFYWRHKLLKTLQQIDIPSFQGIVEMDETYFLYSQKGHRNITDRKPRKRGGSAKLRGISHEQVCVLVARDRAKRTISKVTCMGRILKTQVDRVVGKKLSSTNVLCTDAWRAYKTYAKEKAIPHYRLKSNEGTHVIKGIYHIQNVNSYHSRLKQWLYRFKGVASKYLDHYLAWFRFLEARGHENSIHNLKEMLMSACTYRINETYKTLRLSTFSIS